MLGIKKNRILFFKAEGDNLGSADWFFSCLC